VLVRQHEEWIIRAATRVPTTADIARKVRRRPPQSCSISINPRQEHRLFSPASASDRAEAAAGLVGAIVRTVQRRAHNEWLATVADQIRGALARAPKRLIRRRARDLEALRRSIARCWRAWLDTLLDAIVNSAQVRFGLPCVTV
jgi:hypothetical protein